MQTKEKFCNPLQNISIFIKMISGFTKYNYRRYVKTLIDTDNNMVGTTQEGKWGKVEDCKGGQMHLD